MDKELRKNIELSYLGFKDQAMDDYYKNFFGVISRLRVKKILEELRNAKNKCVLDAGCEAGWLSFYLTKSKARIIPFDFLRSALVSFKQKLYKCRDGKSNIIGLLLATVYNIPIKSSSMDYIICSEVIQLTPYIQSIIKEFERVLKKNGKLIITFPNETFKRKLYPIASILGVNVSVQDEVTPYPYSLDEIKRIIKKYFKIQKVRQLPFSSFPITNVIVCQK